MIILWTSSMPLDIFNMYYNIIIQDNNQVLIFYLIVSVGFWSSNCSSYEKYRQCTEIAWHPALYLKKKKISSVVSVEISELHI